MRKEKEDPMCSRTLEMRWSVRCLFMSLRKIQQCQIYIPALLSAVPLLISLNLSVSQFLII